MKYRLDELQEMASHARLAPRRPSPDRLDIVVAPEVVLVFANLAEEDDTVVAFEGTPWHSHGVLQFTTGPDSYVEYDELDVLGGLLDGSLLVVSEFRQGSLHDRWIAHRLDGSDVRYMEPGDEIRYYRVHESNSS